MTTTNEKIVSINARVESDTSAKSIAHDVKKLVGVLKSGKEKSQPVLVAAMQHAVTYQTPQCINNFYGAVTQVMPTKSHGQLRAYIEAAVSGIAFDKAANGFRRKAHKNIEGSAEALAAMGSWYDFQPAKKHGSADTRTPEEMAAASLAALGKKDGCDVLAHVLLDFMRSEQGQQVYLAALAQRAKEMAADDVAGTSEE